MFGPKAQLKILIDEFEHFVQESLNLFQIKKSYCIQCKTLLIS